MRGSRLTILAIGAVGLVATGAVALTSCAGGISSDLPRNSGSEASQTRFISEVLRDQSALFDGYVQISGVPATAKVDHSYTLTVLVCGNATTCRSSARGGPPTPTDSGPATPTAVPTRPGGQVKVGGVVSTRLTSDMPGTTTALSSQRQPILSTDDVATWQWTVTARQSGMWSLQLRITVLRGDTDEPLIPEKTIDVPVTVSDTVAHDAGQAWSWVKEISAVLAASGVSLVAVIAYLRRRMRRRTTENQPAADRADTGSG